MVCLYDIFYAKQYFRIKESECATVSDQLFLGFGYGDVFQAFVRSEILKSYVSEIFLGNFGYKYLLMVGNPVTENMSDELEVDEIQLEVKLAEEFQDPLTAPDGSTCNDPWVEVSSTPVKVNKFEGIDNNVDSKTLCLSEKKTSSLVDVQTESIMKGDIISESSTWNTAHSPLLFTPVKGENTYGAGYLSQSSSNHFVNWQGSASVTSKSVFSTPPPKSAKKLNLVSTAIDHQAEENSVKCVTGVNVNGCVGRFLHCNSSHEGESNISRKIRITPQECSNSFSKSSVDNANLLTSTCGVNYPQNYDVKSRVEFGNINKNDGEEGIMQKKSAPPESSPIPQVVHEEGHRLPALLTDQKYSRVPTKPKRKLRLRTLLSRLRLMLNRLPPPPSVTIPQLTVTEMLEKIYNSDLATLGRNSASKSLGKANISVEDGGTSLFRPSASEEEIMRIPWPDILDCIHPGVCYNLGCSSETLEDLCQQVREKYVGNETASSCSIWSLPKLNEASKHKKTSASLASNIAREGYITRRRQAFSIASLTKAAPTVISKSRQILVNGLVKKPNERKNLELKHKREQNLKGEIRKEDEKQLLPRKSFGEKAGSAKKRNSIRRSLSFDEFSGNLGHSSSKSSTSTVSPRMISTKRVLTFGIEGNSTSKMDTSSSTNLPCSSDSHKDSMEYKRNQPACSRNTLVTELSDVHKKKLLWAVAQALRSRGLGTEHSKFKICAVPLFRLCREEFLNTNKDTRRESAGSSDGSDSLCPSIGSSDSQRESTSDKMLAIALSLVDKIMRELGVSPVVKDRVQL